MTEARRQRTQKQEFLSRGELSSSKGKRSKDLTAKNNNPLKTVLSIYVNIDGRPHELQFQEGDEPRYLEIY